MYVGAATNILALLPMLPQTNTAAGYSETGNIIAKHITRAEALVNSKISARYDVSLFTSTSVPPILKVIAEDITSFYTLRSLYSQDNQNVSEWVENFSEAIKLLDEIRDGKRDILDPSGNIIGASSTAFTVESTTEDYDPTFDELDPVDWEVDSDK